MGGSRGTNFQIPAITPPRVNAPIITPGTPQTPDLRTLISQGLFSTAPQASSGSGNPDPGLGAQSTQTTGPMTSGERTATGLFGTIGQAPTSALIGASLLADFAGVPRETSFGNPIFSETQIRDIAALKGEFAAQDARDANTASAAGAVRGTGALSETATQAESDAASTAETDTSGQQGTDSASGQGADAGNDGGGDGGDGGNDGAAHGDIIHATKATSEVFGEAGPELGLFIPDDIAKIPPKKKQALITVLQEQLFKLQGEDNGRSIPGTTGRDKK
jgi:hypothetical protein